MITLRHASTRHEIRVDAESLDFWKAAGYREVDQKPRKTAAKKAAAKSSK